MGKGLRRKKRGFTLIELIIVIAIIAILAAMIVPSMLGTKSKAQVKVNRQSVRAITNALQEYYADNDTFPSLATGDTVDKLFTGALKDDFDGKEPTYKDGSTKIVASYEQTDSGQDYKLKFNDDKGTKTFDESLVKTGNAESDGTKTVMNPGTAAVAGTGGGAGTPATAGYITKDYKYDKLFK